MSRRGDRKATPARGGAAPAPDSQPEGHLPPTSTRTMAGIPRPGAIKGLEQALPQGTTPSKASRASDETQSSRNLQSLCGADDMPRNFLTTTPRDPGPKWLGKM